MFDTQAWPLHGAIFDFVLGLITGTLITLSFAWVQRHTSTRRKAHSEKEIKGE
jgi:hypothetical protein